MTDILLERITKKHIAKQPPLLIRLHRVSVTGETLSLFYFRIHLGRNNIVCWWFGSSRFLYVAFNLFGRTGWDRKFSVRFFFIAIRIGLFYLALGTVLLLKGPAASRGL